MHGFLSAFAMVVFLYFCMRVGWRSGAPKDQKRPGYIERHPDGSRQGPWGPAPRIGEVRRAYYAVRRSRGWSGHGWLPRRPRL